MHNAITEGAQKFLARPVRGLPLKICAHCATPFPDDYKVQRFCKAHWRIEAKRRTRYCAECGRRFLADLSAKRIARFCSNTCRRRSYARTHRPCLHCRKVFELPSNRFFRRFCSLACACDHRAGYVYKHCAECGRYFRTYKSAKNRQRFCCRKCWKRHDYYARKAA